MAGATAPAFSLGLALRLEPGRDNCEARRHYVVSRFALLLPVQASYKHSRSVLVAKQNAGSATILHARCVYEFACKVLMLPLSTLAQGGDGVHLGRAVCWEIASQRGHCK